jgi:uncharacterized protein (UPF0332 family)
MEDTADQNIEAAERLCELGDPLPKPAVSRAYYAAYLAVWAELVHRGATVPDYDGSRYFRHPDLPALARSRGVLDAELADVLGNLHSSRIKADYWEDMIDREDAASYVEDARRIVSHVLDGVASND